MIYLENNKVNVVALTLTEMDTVGATANYYYLDIKNTFTLEEIDDIEIRETNTDTSRYNRFFISLSTLTSMDITEDTTLEDDYVYVINGPLTVEPTIVLTIPESTTILCTDIIMYGTASHSENIIEFDGDLSQLKWSINTTLDDDPVTLLYGLEPGDWLYTAKSTTGLVLETGIMRIQNDSIPETDYTPA